MFKLQKLLTLLPVLVLVWYVGRFVAGISPFAVRLMMTVAAMNAIVAWLLRYKRNYLLRVAKIPGFRHYLKLVCRLTGEQFPVGSTRRDAHEGLSLRNHEEFEAAIAEAQAWVRGQPDAIERYLRHVRDSAILRQRMKGSGDDRPLTCLLLSGAAGIGKRYLSRVLGRLIFLHGTEQVWELDKLGTDPATAIFGTQTLPSQLLSSLSRQPFQTLIFENIETANPPLQDLLRIIMQQGLITHPSTGRQISFQNTILVMTTTRCGDALKALGDSPLTEADKHAQAIDAVSMGTGLAPQFLACLNDFIVLESPCEMTKAEVISLAMGRECSKYGVRLEYVAPELLLQEVELIGDGNGFSLLEDRTKKMLQPALLEAARRKKHRMVLNAKPLTDVAN